MTSQLKPGQYGADDLGVGTRIDCGCRQITPEVIDQFADLTGDHFEIHMSDAAAQSHGFARRVAHGLLILSVIDGLKNQADVQLKARASLGWTWRFAKPVLAGDTVFVAYDIAKIAAFKDTEDQAILTLDFRVWTQNDVTVQSGTNALLC